MSERRLQQYEDTQALIKGNRAVRKKIEEMLLVLFPIDKYSDKFRKSILDMYLFPSFELDKTQKDDIRGALHQYGDAAEDLLRILEATEV